MSAEPPPVPVPAPPTWRDRLDLLLQPAGGPPPATLVAGGLAVVALAVLGWLVLRTPAAPPAESLMAPVSSAPTATTTGGALVVHAAGAVARPGVYELRAGARVQDLLAAAGGAAPGAQLDRLNLAAPLVDGSQVYVPREGEAAPPSASGAGAPAGPLDLNTATVEQLEELPGVGPATAQAIVAAREELGGFRSVEDLLDVRGIGPAKFEALRDLVTV
jgi:competence protein ComEA